MKIKVESKSLRDAISKVEKAIATTATIDYFSAYLFSVENDAVYIQGFDGTTAVMTTIPIVEYDVNGCFVVNGNMFGEIIKKFPNDAICTLELDVAESLLYVSCDNKSVSVKVLDGNNYPAVPFVETDNTVSVDGIAFQKAIQNALVCVAKPTETRAMLKGINVKITPSDIIVAALDGYRLSKVEIEGTYGDNANYDFTMPVKLAQLISNSILPENNTITLGVAPRSIIAKIGDSIIYGSLLEGDYVDYNRLIDSSYKYSCEMSRMAIINDVDLSMVAAKSSLSKLVKFVIAKDEISISSASEITQIKSTEECKSDLEDETITIGMNGTHVLDVLKALNKDNFTISFTAANQPVAIYEDNAFYLVLPVRIVS